MTDFSPAITIADTRSFNGYRGFRTFGNFGEEDRFGQRLRPLEPRGSVVRISEIVVFEGWKKEEDL